MPLSIKEYKRQRDELRQRFQDEKTGDQTLFIDQTKLFKPLIETQKESSKAIVKKIVLSQDGLSNALVPFTRELQKRNEQVEALQNLPLYNTPLEIESIPQSTPQKHPVTLIDLDGTLLLNQTHIENLEDMGLDLPSVVQSKGTYSDTMNKVNNESKKLGQLLRKDRTKDKKERALYESQKNTLNIYRKKIKGLIETEQFIKTGKGLSPKIRKLVKPKRGRGRPRIYPDVILYNSPYELCVKLCEKIAARDAGNTGLDNIITSILDELLNIKYVSKTDYDALSQNIF